MFINLEPIDLPLKERLMVAQILTNYMMSSATPACFEAKEYGKIAKDAAFKFKYFLEEVVEENVDAYMIEDLNDTIASAIADQSLYEEKNIVVNIDDEIEKQSFIADEDDKEVSRSVLKWSYRTQYNNARKTASVVFFAFEKFFWKNQKFSLLVTPL